MKGERVILGNACPECGGTEYYFADCLDDLHGEGEKYDEKPWPGPEDIIKMRRGEKGEEPCYVCKQVGNHESWCSRGKPSPTREEWEKWISKYPRYGSGFHEHITEWQDILVEWFLSMPIVPKG